MKTEKPDTSRLLADMQHALRILDILLSRWKSILPPRASDKGIVEEIAQDLQELLVPLARVYDTMVRSVEMRDLARTLRSVCSPNHTAEPGNLVGTQRNILKLVYHLSGSSNDPARDQEFISRLVPEIGMHLQIAYDVLNKVLADLSRPTQSLDADPIVSNVPSVSKLRKRSIAMNAWALLIGVSDYTHPRFTNLPVTVRDVQALADILADPARCAYHRDNVQVLTGKQATAKNIRMALRTLTNSVTQKSSVLIYFSGHGGRALEEGFWRTYLCPREANPDDLAHTAISGEEFSALLAAIPARKLLVILDACHAAGSADLKAADGTIVWKAGLPDTYYEVLSRGTGRVVIASCKEDQFSYIRPQGDLSLFTYHLVQALEGEAAVRGDGLIHVLDVFHYVNEAVQADQPKQTPILKAQDLDLNFPIALAPETKASVRTPKANDIAAIREQIVRDPIAGAKALSEYLTRRPEWAAKRNEVDLKRAELERVQREIDLFGPDENSRAAKNRAVFFLLQVCLALEQENS